MEELIQPVLVSFGELVKFTIMESINTGNKTRDNLFIAILLGIFTTVFSKKFYIKVRMYMNYGFDIPSDEVLRDEMLKFATKTPPTTGSMTTLTHNEVRWVSTLKKGSSGASFIIYWDRKYHMYTDGYTVYYNNKTLYEKLKTLVGMEYEKPPEMKDEKDNWKLKIRKYSVETKCPLANYYHLQPDRNFDNIVSNHKNYIISLLDNFTAINSGEKTSLGSYNLGFMFYGKPGAGKTMFAKCIANYLKRDILIIDMRTIKMAYQFEQIFNMDNLNKYVFLFDEFDFIKDVVSQRGSDYEKMSGNIASLKEKLRELIAIPTKDSVIITEIENTKAEIVKAEQAFGLDTMLTVLDGICEMRNRVIIASTNFIDRIDTALVRPGRFDVVLELGELDSEEVKELVKLYYRRQLSTSDLSLIDGTKFKNKCFIPIQIINICATSRTVQEAVNKLKQNT